jgi:putative endonuclease
MKSRFDIGKYGESIACQFLIKKGWHVLSRNVRRKSDEIDIIAKDGRETLVFVEVKTMVVNNLSTLDALRPEDNLTHMKLRKLTRTCEFFARKYADIAGEEAGWRIDLVAVELFSDGERISDIRHYENV